MRIALTTTDYPPDQLSYGAGTYVHTLAQALTQRGHVVHVITRSMGKNATESNGNLTVHRIGPPRFKLTESVNALTAARLITTGLLVEWHYRRQLAKKLEELIQTGGLDLIESVDGGAESLLYQPGKRPHIPFVVKLHSPSAVWEIFDKTIPERWRKVLRLIERQLLLKATHVTAPSQGGAAIIAREMRLEQRVRILPNPPAQFSQLAHSSIEDSKLVLFVGRITPGKGVHVLLEAIPRVLEVFPETRFLLVGGDSFSEQRFLLNREKLLATLPSTCHHAVQFTGHLPHEQVENFYQEAAVCVIPSLFDNFPYTCLEAMSYGKAIVGSRNGGMQEMLDDGCAGLLYTPPDANELAGHIIHLLRHPELRSSLGTRAKRRALTVYNKDEMVDNTIAFYESAVAELRLKHQPRLKLKAKAKA